MLQSIEYSLEVIQDEARQLVERGTLSRQQPIYALCCYLQVREWTLFEAELERNDFLLRDQIVDLIGPELWQND